MVLRIIFNTIIENYFFIVLIIIFRGITNIFLGLQCFEGLAVEVDWFESLTSLGDHFENFKVEECFQRERQGETLSGRKSCVVMTKIHNGSIINAALAKKVTCDIRCHFIILILTRTVLHRNESQFLLKNCPYKSYKNVYKLYQKLIRGWNV